MQLSPPEARVLGVLIEKALTTPNQYPLSLNAITAGCNQRNNREPVTDYDDDTAFAALQSLRQKGLIVQVDQVGSRVHKYRHNAGETLDLAMNETAVLAELLLRGPQTLGELRGRASRMATFDSLVAVQVVLDQLVPPQRTEALIRRIAPAPGTRAERYMQLLCPELPQAAAVEAPPAAAPPAPDELRELRERIESLESQVADLRQMLEDLTK